MSLYPDVIGILGGGQLGRMLVQAASLLNIETLILDKAGAPAKQVNASSEHIDGQFTDPEKISELAKKATVLTVEIEHVDTHALEQVSKTQGVPVEPHWRTIRIIQNKFEQKNHLTKHGVAVAEYEPVSEKTEDELKRIGSALGYPFMLKAQTEAYDGKGNCPIRSPSDISSALKALALHPLYAEKWADFKMELAVMVVKTKDLVLSFPTVETVHEDSICKLVYAPARNVSKAINEKAQALARDAVAAFEGKGVFGVEMFLLHNDTLLVNEIAPRPHNSGHYTIEACATSQYAAHLQAILDIPIAQEHLALQLPAIMLNILGGAQPDSHLELARAAVKVGAHVHMYGKGAGKSGRKMGHITLTRSSMIECEKAIGPLVAISDKLYAERTGKTVAPSDHKPSEQSSPPHFLSNTPLIAIIMGSDSDMPVLQPGLELLTSRFHIPVDVAITSAHRTPEHMASYVSGCADKGIKVIIAAAGGAAHLPGMASGHTHLPVIGVPVKGKVLDGLDSLLSEVQMPPGVPTAIIGINNSINAALLALRILAQTGAVEGLVERLKGYMDEMRDGVLEKDKKLRKIGWKAYLEQMPGR